MLISNAVMKQEAGPEPEPEMGCTASAAQPPDVAGSALFLPHSKLKFSLKQLRSLNTRLTKLVEDEKEEPLSEDMEIIAERLVQGIVAGAAKKDARFKSKYIVFLNKHRMLQSRSLEYLVIMEGLRGHCAVAEGPPGCARLRPEDSDLWEDFLTASGFLRRDKVVERWVEVLAWAAAGEACSGGGAPGLLVPSTAYPHVRDLPFEQQCYYGDVHEDLEPSHHGYRVAIVEGAPWVRVRMAGGVLGARGVQAKLALAVPYSGWPQGSDFPNRAPLGHPDALMFYSAAQTGFYIVGGAPAAGVQWSERCAGWQLWAEGARALLGARGEGAARVAEALGAVLKHLREQGQPPLRAVSRFMVEEALLWRLERPVARGPAGDLRAWSSSNLAHHVLFVLDTVLGQLTAKTGRHYFFPGCDVIKMAVWRGARVGERDWRGDAACLAEFISKLHTDGAQMTTDEEPSWGRSRLEGALVTRWGLLLQEMTPAGGTRGGRMTGAGAAPYSPRQLAYLAAAARGLLTARRVVIQDSNEWFQGGLSTTITQPQDPIEDLIHLLAIILDQARDYFLKTHVSNGIFDDVQSKEIKKSSTVAKKTSSKDTLKRHKLKNCYDASAAYLIDAVRRDSDTQKEDLTDDSVLMRTLLKWLYKAVDDDKKYLSPVLKPYLELLFVTSHENSWHLEEFNSRICTKEFEALTLFSKLVHDGHVSPAQGIVDAAAKGWKWAEKMLEILEIITNSGTVLRLVFPKHDGPDMRFDLSLPADARERDKWNSFHANKKNRLVAKLNMAEQCVVEAFICSLDNEAMGYEGVVQNSKSEEILSSGKVDHTISNGDISKTHTLRSNTGTIDTMATSDSKYHTMRSISSKYSTLRNSESLFGSCWSAGDTLRLKHGVQRPTVLEEINHNGEKRFTGYDDIETSLHCCLRDATPLSVVLEKRQALAPHREYEGIIRALINMQRYSVLQELSGWLSGKEERAGALKALHRLARGGRRASGPLPHALPSAHRHNYTLSPKRPNLQHKIRASVRQYYRRRNIDAVSGDESSSRKSEMKPLSSPDNSTESGCQSPSSSIIKDDELNLEVQREYLHSSTLHDIEQNTTLSDHYMNLCREAIRDSNMKRSHAAFQEFNRNISSKNNKGGIKDKHRASSLGRKTGSESKKNLNIDKYGMVNTVGRNTAKELKVSTDSLLGTCREARLHHAAKRSALPGVSSSDVSFGDAFKVSPLFSSGASQYEVMTQSILQGAVPQPGRDRQRHLTAPRDKLYP